MHAKFQASRFNNKKKVPEGSRSPYGFEGFCRPVSANKNEYLAIKFGFYSLATGQWSKYMNKKKTFTFFFRQR